MTKTRSPSVAAAAADAGARRDSATARRRSRASVCRGPCRTRRPQAVADDDRLAGPPAQAVLPDVRCRFRDSRARTIPSVDGTNSVSPECAAASRWPRRPRSSRPRCHRRRGAPSACRPGGDHPAALRPAAGRSAFRPAPSMRRRHLSGEARGSLRPTEQTPSSHRQPAAVRAELLLPDEHAVRQAVRRDDAGLTGEHDVIAGEERTGDRRGGDRRVQRMSDGALGAGIGVPGSTSGTPWIPSAHLRVAPPCARRRRTQRQTNRIIASDCSGNKPTRCGGAGRVHPLIIASSDQPIAFPLPALTVNHQTIVVLDFGSQFTQLIARRLRELSVYAEILPFDTPLAKIRERQPVGIILSGGPKSVSDAGAPHCDMAIYESGVPVLGICYGMQLMTHALGGPSRLRRIASSVSRRSPSIPRRRSSPRSRRELRVWASHGDFVQAAPAGFAVTATSANAPVAAMAAAERSLYALLFHPGSRAHRLRPRDPPQLRLRRLRLHRRLDDEVVCRRSDGEDPRAGR